MDETKDEQQTTEQTEQQQTPPAPAPTPAPEPRPATSKSPETKSESGGVPADIQAMRDAWTKKLIAAEVKVIGAGLNLVDTDAAFALMDKSGVAVSDDGGVTGVQEALNALIKAKPYLIKQTPPGTGSAGNFPRGNGTKAADYAVRLSDARKSGNNALATAIISEAAGEGIILR